MSVKKATEEDIKIFLEGRNDEKYIVGLETDESKDYSVDNSNNVFLFYDDPIKGKYIKRDKFTPFCWVKDLNGSGFYNDDLNQIKKAMKTHNIFIEKLETDGVDRLVDGYKYIIKTTGTFWTLYRFFKNGGINPFRSDYIIFPTQAEQYFIQTGKRLFKGYELYDDVHRLVFDIETTSLDPKNGHIFLIGIIDNRGYKKILSSYDENGNYKKQLELDIIIEFFEIIKELNPSIICGYNSENFDFEYIIGRIKDLGFEPNEIIETKHPNVPIKREVRNIKYGGESEKYTATIMWGYNIVDTLHRVREAAAINSDLKEMNLKYIAKESKVVRENRVYISGDKIGVIWVKNEKYCYNKENGKYYLYEDNLKEGYEVVDGRFLVSEYLYDDLIETMAVDEIFSQASFLTSKLLPNFYGRSVTMGNASKWQLLMLSWSYENGLAIPLRQPKRDIVGGLSRLLCVGFSRNVVKFDFNSLYPSIELTHDVFPIVDISGALEAMLRYFYNTRTLYKNLMNEYEEKGDDKQKRFYEKKQLPIKILNNSQFGALSAPYLFNWGDNDIGEQITCTGRQYLRLMVHFFIRKGYKPLVLDTDGVNFTYDSETINTHKYIGKGTHKTVKKDVLYEGVKADVAEFNEKYMYGYMGLDIDYFSPATINLSRKNYVLIKPNGKIKMTGNSIKSKKIQTYVQNFLNKTIALLLDGKGKEFVIEYNAYITKIYNKQIPLIEIANKAKIKNSIKNYQNRGADKNGKALAKQAHMELVIENDIKVNLGDVIYYVNNGKKKSHGDIQTKKGELIFNCYLVNKEELDKNPELLGDYNVDKYIDILNKKLEPFMVVFKPSVRDKILVKNPNDLNFFTSSDLELISGVPIDEHDQDDLDKDLMTKSEEENIFWKKTGINPHYMIKKNKELVN